VNSSPTRADWLAKASSLTLTGQPFIDGRRVEALTEDRFDVCRAADRGRLISLPDCGSADVDRAVAAARRAFDSAHWSARAPRERALILHRWADLIERDAETLALLDTLQMGMPVSQSVGGMGAAAGIVRDFADLADQQSDQALPSAASALVLQLRRPRGVVAAITPWNYPVHVALSRVVPALAAGNSVVLKPSELAPLACLRLADLAAEAGLPEGVLNALPGRGAVTGRLLALHPGVDCLSFVGSTATGLMLMQYAGQSNMKTLLLECGGKSPQVVFDDVGDIEALADALVQGFVFNSGQICVTGSRILVAGPLYERLSAALVQRVASTRTGDPLDPATTLGPLAHAQQHERVTRLLGAAQPSDRLLAQGQVSGGSANEVAPHLFEALDAQSALAQEEIFGPVASLIRFDDEAQALALANGTRYGLSATVWCSDFQRAHRFVRTLRAGYVTVNTVANPQAAGHRYLSFEPSGLSGLGVDGGAAGMLSYTRLQGITCHLA
jgi:acyl-CoA reductase-like NAD-dependent aldehyde dehydrogenase